MRRVRARGLTLGAALMLLSVWAVPTAGQVGRPSRHAGRPPVQAGVPGSASYMSIVRTFPAGSSVIEFDYFVDTEQGDRLNLYAIGVSPTPIWTVSGFNLAGRAAVPVSLAGAAWITVRFEYAKNGNANHGGEDDVWVDRVRFVGAEVGTFFSADFDRGPLSAQPDGWQAGGTGGGWITRPYAVARSAARPPDQPDGTTSFMERTIAFPLAAGGIDFDYYVDSEAGHDVLGVTLDGAEVDLDPELPGTQGISGRHRSGHVSMPVTGVGQHHVRFEYRKDATGSDGFDLARVDRIHVRRTPTGPAEFHEFEGRVGGPGGIRHAISGPIEWSGDWVAAPATPHRTFVPPQVAGQKWDPAWQEFQAPQLDGSVGSDYRNRVQLELPNHGNSGPGAEDGTLLLVATADTLYLGLRVQAATAAPGSEAGRLRMYLDAAHAQTVGGTGGCGGGIDLPQRDDRMIDLSYAFSQPQSLTPTQLRGNCDAGTPWVPLDPYDLPWQIAVALAEPASDTGFVHLEIVIALPSAVAADTLLGLALIRENTAGSPALERFPYLDDGAGPQSDSPASWETVAFYYEEGTLERSENPWDIGGYPMPSRPLVHW